MAQFPTFGNATGVWNLNDVYNNVSGGTWPNFSARGIFATSITPAPGSRNQIEFITISTAGNSTDFGDATNNLTFPSAAGNQTRSLFGPSERSAPVGYSALVDYVVPSTLGNAANFGSLTINRSQSSGLSNSTRAVFGGGFAETPGNTWYNVIDYLQISSLGNGLDFGDLTVALALPSAAASSTRGLFAGGYTPTVINVIQFITIATTGNASDFGDLTSVNLGGAGVSSSTRGLFGGGETPTKVSTIDYVTISSAGNATDFGDLTQARGQLSAASNSIRGVFAGGQVGPAGVNTIDFVNITIGGNANDFGDLVIASYGGAGTSTAHGGLSDGYQGTGPTVYFNSGDAAVFMGGFQSTPAFVPYSTIDTIKISSAGNATSFGSLAPSSFTNTAAAGTVSSAIRGLYAGGDNNSGVTNTIQYITFSTLGNAADFGDLTLPRYSLAGVSNSTRGIMAGGFTTTPSSINTNVIDYVTIATIGNATDFGDLTLARREFGGGGSPTRALFMGGGNPAVNIIDYVTIGTTGNATDFGDLTSNIGENSVVTSSTRAVTVGADGAENVMEYVTIATTGNALDFGDLTVGRRNVAGGSNSIRGVCAGGVDVSTFSNVIDFITIASVGNATDFGDLTIARRGLTGASNGHGGLQ